MVKGVGFICEISLIYRNEKTVDLMKFVISRLDF